MKKGIERKKEEIDLKKNARASAREENKEKKNECEQEEE